MIQSTRRPPAADLDEYFTMRIEFTDSGCWEWQGSRSRAGYGYLAYQEKRGGAHRWLWKTYVGDVPDDLDIDHLCKNVICVNPDHLEPVTHAENIARGDYSNNGAHWAAKTHCPQGHAYAGDNLYIYRGTRRCRTCNRLAMQRSRRRKRQP